MSKLNWLYDFKVNKEVKEEQKEKSKDENGEEITISKTITKKEPVTFHIRKPNRKLYEDGEMHYAVKLSEGIKAGLLTRALLAKRYKDDGGPMSEPEKQRYAEVYYDIAQKQDELEKLKLNLEKESEEIRTKKANEIISDIMSLQEEIQEYELAQSTLFDQTAENRAKNSTIMWWVLNVAYQKEGETRFNQVFGEGTYDERMEKYDELEELNDPFWTEVVKKFAYFITFWYMNGLSDAKEFEEVENLYKQENFEQEDEEELIEDLEKEAKEAEAAEDAEKEDKAEESKAEDKAEDKAEEPKAEEPKAEKSKPSKKKSKAEKAKA